MEDFKEGLIFGSLLTLFILGTIALMVAACLLG